MVGLQCGMEWARPQYSHQEINRSGKVIANALAHEDEVDRALEIINNWRSSHAYPLAIFQAQLRAKIRRLNLESTIAQRIKRLPSITRKLKLFPKMKLSQMQDIGGCRAVVSSCIEVRKLVNSYKNSYSPHFLHEEYDYIQKPKSSGYRGIHLVYRYSSASKPAYKNLRIELQFRSARQHAWATAVEIVDHFTRQALKSSQGEEDWKRFFALMGCAIALREKCPAVPETPSERHALRKEIREYERKLRFIERLDTYRAIFEPPPFIRKQKPQIFLLCLDLEEQRIEADVYKDAQLEEAFEDYAKAEKRYQGDRWDIVLVSVKSLSALRRAYPNYFLDTSLFMKEVKRAIR